MALTIQQVHNTADQLQGQGIKPTLAEVRKALGGGSFTTISEAMKSWRQDNQEEAQLRQVELPSGITERLQTLGADMWQTAVDIANDRLVKDREALESIKAKAQAETDEAQEAVKTLESEQADLLVQLDEVTATAETKAKAAERRQLNVIGLSRSWPILSTSWSLNELKQMQLKLNLQICVVALISKQKSLTSIYREWPRLRLTLLVIKPRLPV